MEAGQTTESPERPATQTAKPPGVQPPFAAPGQETPGLPSRSSRSAPAPAERPTVAESLDRAASGSGVTRSMEEVLMGHFFGDEPAAGEGEDDRLDLEVDLGHGRVMTLALRPLDWAEWREAQSNSRRTDGSIDEFFLASWTISMTVIDSPLGRIVARMKEEDPEKAPTDAAALLRRYFRKQSGTLIQTHVRLLALSNLSATSDAVREVEAGKD